MQRAGKPSRSAPEAAPFTWAEAHLPPRKEIARSRGSRPVYRGEGSPSTSGDDDKIARALARRDRPGRSKVSIRPVKPGGFPRLHSVVSRLKVRLCPVKP